jgi:hypothetical protein
VAWNKGSTTVVAGMDTILTAFSGRLQFDDENFCLTCCAMFGLLKKEEKHQTSKPFTFLMPLMMLITPANQKRF